MGWVAGVLCVSALGDVTVWVFAVIGCDLAGTVVLEALSALLAIWLEAGPGLRTDTYAVPDFDVLDVLADFDCFAYNFVADAAGVFRWPLFSISECFMRRSQA